MGFVCCGVTMRLARRLSERADDGDVAFAWDNDILLATVGAKMTLLRAGIPPAYALGNCHFAIDASHVPQYFAFGWLVGVPGAALSRARSANCRRGYRFPELLLGEADGCSHVWDAYARHEVRVEIISTLPQGRESSYARAASNPKTSGIWLLLESSGQRTRLPIPPLG